MARLACLVVALSCASAFTTTLHGGSNEDTAVGTPGAATLLRQPWLTTYDPDVRLLPAAQVSNAGISAGCCAGSAAPACAYRRRASETAREPPGALVCARLSGKRA